MNIYKGICHNGEIEIKTSDLKYSTPYFDFYQDKVIFPNMNHGDYTRIEPIHSGGVAILPIDTEGNITLINCFRHAIRKFSIEVPRGFIDDNESPFEAAIRELKEETGATSNNIIYAGQIYPDNSILNTNTHMFIATNVVFTRMYSEPGEAIEKWIKYSPHTIIELIRQNEINDSFTLGLLTKAFVLGLLKIQA